MNPHRSCPLMAMPGSGDCLHDRLAEARGIIADVAQHPETLVILAARVVAGQSDDAGECADAHDLLHLLDRRRRFAIAAATAPNGGAA